MPKASRSARKRDARGRFVKGCTHSRDAKTGRCRSALQHERRRRKLAMRTISRRVRELRASRPAYEDYVPPATPSRFSLGGTARDVYEDYLPPYAPSRFSLGGTAQEVYSPFLERASG